MAVQDSGDPQPVGPEARGPDPGGAGGPDC